MSVSSYARRMYWCLKCIYSLNRVWSIQGTCKPLVLEIAQFKGHWLWLHTKKIKYWQRLPAKLRRIIQGGKEQKKVKQGCRDYNDRGLIKYWLAPAAQKVEVLRNPKSKRICLKFSKWSSLCEICSKRSKWSNSLHQGRRWCDSQHLFVC